ncbi:hras-like suppressor 3 [Plakobranchus ocellatus]|uniref:Hras-like suppressor 3 n=1 Tax=Plakobranchus ocellatus TaxID=259542 RepID=A0AAV3YGD7_9GAST|nr:hras-like suppressor 3 [Plakobranchus ocellatus]
MQKALNRAHNQTVLFELEPGDLVKFPRGPYSHWAVYLGNEEVVHLAGVDNDGINAKIRPEHLFTISGVKFNKAAVCIDNFWDVVEDSRAEKNNKGDRKHKPLPRREILARATSKLGEVAYNVIFSNCEHFARWCRNDIFKSEQVDDVMTGAAVVGGAVLAGAAVYAICKWWGATPEKESKRK